ncbi:MAG: AraC family transcriptional regulator [Clostridiales bacterium]|nr:AraC family transcriptional regulator [Clostridiales bacterium]
MDYKDLSRAIDYIESHLLERIDYGEAAKRAYSSTFHFQKVFALLCGITVGEYIRRRRLSLAGAELLGGNVKVIDLAFKYGYQTPESFSRAFVRFHGILPSKVKSDTLLNSYSRPLNITSIGGKMDSKIVEKSEMILVGYKRRFTGAPYGDERTKQENDFFCSTRAKQWLLIGASDSPAIDYAVVTNVDDDGYDFYIAYELDEWTRENLFNKHITGVDLATWGLCTIIIPKQTYVVFSTPNAKYPVKMYSRLREQIVASWLPRSDFEFVNAPEIVAYHWREGRREEWAKDRYIEVYMPVKLKM